MILPAPFSRHADGDGGDGGGGDGLAEKSRRHAGAALIPSFVSGVQG